MSAAAEQDAPTIAPHPVEVLWRDAHAAVVHKPSGMLSHNSAFAGPAEYALLQAARDALGQKIWLVNRLDRGTSGCVLVCFAGTDVAAWSAALQAGQKHYLALVRGRMRAPVTIDKALRDESGVAKAARTTITPLGVATEARVSLVRCALEHGRNHQARRHLNRANHPVVNDANHGDTRFNRAFRETWGVRRLLLHAESIALHHPVTEAPLQVRCPLPEAAAASLSLQSTTGDKAEERAGEMSGEMGPIVRRLLPAEALADVAFAAGALVEGTFTTPGSAQG